MLRGLVIWRAAAQVGGSSLGGGLTATRPDEEAAGRRGSRAARRTGRARRAVTSAEVCGSGRGKVVSLGAGHDVIRCKMDPLAA